MGQPRFYTTQQIAKMLGVSVPTVVNWVKQGRLSAHKTPGGHRRISREALEQFASAYAYPLPGERTETQEKGAHRVLVIDRDPDFAEMVSEYLQLRGELNVRAAVQPLEVGFFLGQFKPHLILIDLEHDQVSDIEVSRLRDLHPQGHTVHLIGTVTFMDALAGDHARQHQLSRILEKPVKLDHLLEEVRAVLS